MIEFKNLGKKGFILENKFHSRIPDKNLTEKTSSLGIIVSKYKIIIENEEVEYIDAWLKEDPLKFIWLCNNDSIRNNPFPYPGYTIHFKTGESLIQVPTENILTQEQKTRLFKAIEILIPKNKILGTYGTITKGGLSAFEKLEKNYGFKKIGVFKEGVFLPGNIKIDIPVLQKR